MLRKVDLAGMGMFRVGSWEKRTWGLPSVASQVSWSWEVWGGWWGSWWASWRSFCTLLALFGCFTGWYALVTCMLITLVSCYVDRGIRELLFCIIIRVVMFTDTIQKSFVKGLTEFFNFFSSVVSYRWGMIQLKNMSHGMWKHAILLMALLEGEQHDGKSHKASTSVCTWPQFSFCYDKGTGCVNQHCIKRWKFKWLLSFWFPIATDVTRN